MPCQLKVIKVRSFNSSTQVVDKLIERNTEIQALADTGN